MLPTWVASFGRDEGPTLQASLRAAPSQRPPVGAIWPNPKRDRRRRAERGPSISSPCRRISCLGSAGCATGHYDLIVLLLFRLVLGDASPHAWRPSPADGTAAIAGRRPPRAAGRRPENDAVTAHATRRDGEDGGGQRSRRSARASRDGSRAVAS